MPRETEPSQNEREFLQEALREDIRLDGRALDAYRDIQVSFGEEYGVADVRLGKTRVLVKTSATLAIPYPDRKFDGIFTITAELSPLASPAFESGRQSDLESHLTLHLDTLLRRSNALSTESLCLVAGKQVWHLRSTVHILDADGSLLTAASLATLASLLHFRIPASEVRGGELRIFGLRERDPVRLGGLLHHPCCIELAYFAAPSEGGEGEGEEVKCVVDPTLMEELVSTGVMVVGANREGEVVLVEKAGGEVVEGVGLLRGVEVGVRKCREMVGMVFKALERDAKVRDRGGMSRELRAENER